jgi:glycosyltransferase 2 family protein
MGSGKAALKVVAAVLGAVISVLLVLTVFFTFDFSQGLQLIPRFSVGKFVRELPRHLRWLVPFAMLTALIIPLRALQWQQTLRKRVPFKERYHLVAIGAFTNNAVPGKFGDVFRAFLLSRTLGIPFMQALGSVAVCKLLEFAALMLLVAASFLGPFAQTMSRFAGGLKIALVACVVLFAVVIFLAHHAPTMAEGLQRKHRFPKLQVVLEHLGDGLGTAKSFRGMVKALFFSIGPVLAPAIAYGLALQFMGVRGGLFAGAVVLGAIALGQLTPGLPAGTGIYYFVTSWAARSLGAAPEDAAAYSALTHLATVATQIAIGGISVWVRKIRWKDLKRKGKIAADAAAHQVGSEAEAAA